MWSRAAGGEQSNHRRRSSSDRNRGPTVPAQGHHHAARPPALSGNPRIRGQNARHQGGSAGLAWCVNQTFTFYIKQGLKLTHIEMAVQESCVINASIFGYEN